MPKGETSGQKDQDAQSSQMEGFVGEIIDWQSDTIPSQKKQTMQEGVRRQCQEKSVKRLNIHKTNCAMADEAQGFDIVTQRRDGVKLDRVLSNSFGFGGTNACLVLQRYSD